LSRNRYALLSEEDEELSSLSISEEEDETEESSEEETMKDPDSREVLVSDRARRCAIMWCFVYNFRSPSPEFWMGKDGTISKVRKELKLPRGSQTAIKAVFNKVRECHEQGQWCSAQLSPPTVLTLIFSLTGVEYDGEDGRCRNRGLKPLIELDSAEAQISADSIEAGSGFTQAMYNVNVYRRKLGNRVAVLFVFVFVVFMFACYDFGKGNLMQGAPPSMQRPSDFALP